MAGIQILPSLDRFAGLRQGANNFVGQLLQGQQRQAGLSDQQSIMQFIQQRQQGQQPGLPQFQTPQGAAAFNSFIGQQQENVALGPGQGLFNRATGQQVGQSQPATPTANKQTSSVISDPNNPNKAIRVRNSFDPAGNLINQVKIGDATLPESIGNVSPEIFNSLLKPVASKIQTELKDAQVDVKNLEAIRGQFKDEFTELPFKIAQGVTKFQEKAGGILGKPSASQVKDLAAFSKWKRGASREFVVFKKWATGVAAGQQEMAQQIETAFASPRKDSATEFKSKLDDSITVRRRTIEILEGFLNSGQITTPGGKRQAEQNALRQALNEHEAGGLGPQNEEGAGVGLPPLDQVRSGAQQNASPMSAVNPKTGARIQSRDGGKTWQPVQ